MKKHFLNAAANTMIVAMFASLFVSQEALATSSDDSDSIYSYNDYIYAYDYDDYDEDDEDDKEEDDFTNTDQDVGNGPAFGTTAADNIISDDTVIMWVQDEDTNKWHLMNEDRSICYRGWYQDKETSNWFYLDMNTTELATGWVTIDDKDYYFSPEQDAAHELGQMYANEATPDGYTVDGNGVRIN